MSDIRPALEAALSGGPERHHAKLAEQDKLEARERVGRLIDAGSFSEEALLANWESEGLGADGVITGTALVGGRRVALMANDPTVKAGSWGPKTVEKILRVQERALKLAIPMIYLVDSAGARITDQVQMFPGRRGAGRIFYNQVRLSGVGAAGLPAVRAQRRRRRLHPGLLRRRHHAGGQRLDVPRLAADGGDGHRREASPWRRWGARRCTPGSPAAATSSPPPTPRRSRPPAATSPTCRPTGRENPPAAPPSEPASAEPIAEIIPADENQPFDMRELIGRLVDDGSLLQVHERWAKELIVGYARLDGQAIGIVANQPRQKGGVLFVDSADKAARFIQTCNAFNIPLLFLADVPGFMIGTAVERQGIIRHGAKMISAVSEATVPKISVIVRKAYGAGLYAMAGPAFEPDCCIALPSASIAVMGPQAAVNAVFFNQIQAIEDPAERERFVAEKRREYAEDIDILHLASELVVDAVIEPAELRAELIKRFAAAEGKDRGFASRRNPVTPA